MYIHEVYLDLESNKKNCVWYGRDINFGQPHDGRSKKSSASHFNWIDSQGPSSLWCICCQLVSSGVSCAHRPLQLNSPILSGGRIHCCPISTSIIQSQARRVTGMGHRAQVGSSPIPLVEIFQKWEHDWLLWGKIPPFATASSRSSFSRVSFSPGLPTSSIVMTRNSLCAP